MSSPDPAMDERVVASIATEIAHHVGEPTGEIMIHEMREFLDRHGYESVPPDAGTVVTARDSWRAVVEVTRRRLDTPDRVLKIAWKK
jgi:hypothetical protein